MPFLQQYLIRQGLSYTNIQVQSESGWSWGGVQVIFIGLQQILYNINYCTEMNCIRELPHEYIELCPIIDEKYRVLFKLGFGRFSKVKMAINLATNQRVAIKIMNQKIDEAEMERGYEDNVLQMFLNEIKMSHEARHKHIIEIVDFNVGGIYRTSDGKIQRILYYVMKIEEYGQLFRVISLTDQFNEKTARFVFTQLMSALLHIHNIRIAHCDIKSENILLDSKFNLKLVDFGCARYFVNENSEPIIYDNIHPIGTLKCNAPQLLNHFGNKKYVGNALDVFAAGCFLFELVMKAQPFKSSDVKDEYYSKLVNFQNKKFWQIFQNKSNPSVEFKDLIEKMLNANPKERISLNEVMEHQWFKGQKINRQQYKKEMNTRMKKIMVKVRKQQELQMKQLYMKEKGKKQSLKLEYFEINIKRQLQEKIFKLKTVLFTSDKQSFDSSSSDEQNEKPAKALQAEGLKKKSSISSRQREDQSRNQ